MDPITLAILGGVAGSALQGLPAIIPSKFESEQNKRLKDLQRKEELGLLGLTENEKMAMENRMAEKSRAAAESAKVERERLLAGAGGAVGAGSALLGAQVAEGQIRQTGTDIARAIEEENLKRVAEQKDELRSLEAAKGQYAQNRMAALAGIGTTGLEAGLTSAAQQKIIQGSRAPSESGVQALASMYGISPEQARGLYEISITNPEVLKLYQSLQNEGK